MILTLNGMIQIIDENWRTKQTKITIQRRGLLCTNNKVNKKGLTTSEEKLLHKRIIFLKLLVTYI